MDLATALGSALPPEIKKLILGKATGYMTTEGRLAYENNFGGQSTEYSIGVKNPLINNGELTHIPSIYGGKVVDEKTAIHLFSNNFSSIFLLNTYPCTITAVKCLPSILLPILFIMCSLPFSSSSRTIQ